MACVLTACSGPRLMMPTPNIYVDDELQVFRNLARPLQSTEVRLFYITDRSPELNQAGDLFYGHGRSASIGFGSALVNLGANLSWEDLVEASRLQKRLKPVHLELVSVKEIVRSPDLPVPYEVRDGQVFEDQDSLAQLEQATNTFRQVMLSQLALSPRKEVFVYIHGYNNTFEDAAFALAELWHFVGRNGVPLIYTWPAGYPGLFGYTYDRESSEFTVYHLREVLKRIASFPEVEKIHLIAHSRGTDVATAALRDLTLSVRGAGQDPKKLLKIDNFVIAAPDLDLQIAEQRFAGDKLTNSVGRFTIYTSPSDKAIGVASRLFASPRGRVGTFGFEQMDESLEQQMQRTKANFAVINFPGAARSGLGQFGHSYFRNAPSVSSDLVLMLRDNADPGTPERPLKQLDNMFWQIPAGYPAGNTH